jgi:hypothetical protein
MKEQIHISGMEGGLLVDVSDKARQEGIDIPVVIATSLAEKLRPTGFLSSMGITFERRVENLLRLVSATLEAGETETPGGKHISFMIVDGPLVRESFFSVIKVARKDDAGNPIIALVPARDNDKDLLV